LAGKKLVGLTLGNFSVEKQHASPSYRAFFRVFPVKRRGNQLVIELRTAHVVCGPHTFTDFSCAIKQLFQKLLSWLKLTGLPSLVFE